GGGALVQKRTRRLAKPARERERQRHGEVAERPLRRRFECDVGKNGIVGRDPIETGDGLGYSRADLLLNGKNHNCSVIRFANGFIVSASLPWRARSHAAC